MDEIKNYTLFKVGKINIMKRMKHLLRTSKNIDKGIYNSLKILIRDKISAILSNGI